MKTNKHGIRQVKHDQGYFLEGVWSTKIIDKNSLTKLINWANSENFEYTIVRGNNGDGLLTFTNVDKQIIKKIKQFIENV